MICNYTLDRAARYHPNQLALVCGGRRITFRELRERARAGQEAGIDWRSTIDALRPISNEVWGELSLTDRRRFMRHLRTLWETHRSRSAFDADRRRDRILQLNGWVVLRLTSQTSNAEIVETIRAFVP